MLEMPCHIEKPGSFYIGVSPAPLKIKRYQGVFKRFQKVAYSRLFPFRALGYNKRRTLIEQSSLEENPHFNGQRASGWGYGGFQTKTLFKKPKTVFSKA